ncbi:tetratricopeptide repeat protein [Fontibacillus phaseoli]|uniref:Tetratricopeptide repeat protein n=1 Tax=Fontibacillus phaseoli TaxID=1416533 RepID=A0A369B873_9BACL|nr:tetratricopeptide repeat protein [Fontibacillus phaseoli]RCX17723.1 tetratricopeptide repeat protein [Fontibacillus phaseoli]
MTREELIKQLNDWHEADEYQQIVDRINEVPTPLIDDELAVHLGRALNNLGRHKDALKWFMKIDEEGRNNPLWHFRVGYAHYYLDQNEEAVKEFEIAHQMDPEDEDTVEFLEWSRKELAQAQKADDEDEDEDEEGQ